MHTLFRSPFPRLIALLLCLVACDEPGASSGPGEPADLGRPDRGLPDGGAADAVDSSSGGEGDLGAPRRGLLHFEIEVSPSDLSAVLADPDARLEVPARVTLGGGVWTGVEFELHGGLARRFEKKSYRLRFPRPRPLLDLWGQGLEPVERLVLQASWVDPSFLRNRIVMDLVREQGGLSPRVSWARVSVNGELQGLYVLMERIDRDYLRRQGLDPEARLYKAENHWANWSSSHDPLRGFREVLYEDGARAVGLEELFRVLAATPTNLEAFRREIEPRLDLEGFACWQLVHAWAMDRDCFTKNHYLYEPPLGPSGPEGRYRVVSWDADATLGNEWDGTPLPADSLGWFGPNEFSVRYVEVPELRAAYLQRLGALLDGAGSSAAFEERLGGLVQTPGLADAANADLAQWPRGGSWEEEQERLRSFVLQRREYLMEELERSD